MADNDYAPDNPDPSDNLDHQDEPMAEGIAPVQPAANNPEVVRFNINVPYQMRYYPQHQMQPAPRPYYGDWARVERDYRAAAEEREAAAARADRNADRNQAGGRGEAGANRSVSPVPPLPFAPEEMSDEEQDGHEHHIHDLANAIDNINVQGPHERHIRQLYDREQMLYDRHNFNSPPLEPQDTYTP